VLERIAVASPWLPLAARYRSRVSAVAGLVLTGGSSRRFGAEKATLLLGGERLADRAMRVLGSVVSPVLEVGPSFVSAEAVREKPAGGGPLVAIVAGAAALERERGSNGPLIALAVDLPRAEPPLLEWLAAHPAPASVVPVVDGMPQTLCARYDVDALTVAVELVDRGERSMRALLDAVGVHYAEEDEWGAVADARAFHDVDTREDAAALGVELPR
jgi:molybdopterin-guanine dinucleotide biosynthesis protein A